MMPVRLWFWLWTAVVLGADLAVFVLLPGWDTSREAVSGPILYAGFTVLIVLTWLAGLLAFVLFRLVGAWWAKRAARTALKP
jgi:hypothetical protein